MLGFSISARCMPPGIFPMCDAWPPPPLCAPCGFWPPPRPPWPPAQLSADLTHGPDLNRGWFDPTVASFFCRFYFWLQTWWFTGGRHFSLTEIRVKQFFLVYCNRTHLTTLLQILYSRMG